MPYLGAPQPYPGAPPAPPPPAVHNPLSLPSLLPIWCPSDRGVELGAPPGDNNGSAVLKWCKITMLFNGSPESQNLVGGKNKQWLAATLKAQSVHQRWRKVCLEQWVRKPLIQKWCAAIGRVFQQTHLYNLKILSNFIRVSSLQAYISWGCFSGRLQNAWSPL